jgi:hypothetical protein
MKRPSKPPPAPERLQVLVRLSEPLAEAIDRWRNRQLDRPSRAEVLRRFAARGIAEDNK